MNDSRMIPLTDAKVNEDRVRALATKYGDKTPYLAVAALGAITHFVPPDIMEQVLKMAEVSVFLYDNKDQVALLKDLKIEHERKTT